MSILVVLDLHARPEHAEAVADRLRAILPDTRAFEGCEEVVVHRDEDDPLHYILEERWTNRSASDAYSAWRSERVEQDGLRALLAEPATKTHFDRLDI